MTVLTFPGRYAADMAAVAEAARRNTHLIVESSDWWLKKIMYRWRLDMFKELGGEFVCIGVSR